MALRKLTKESRVSLVELPPWQFGILNGEPSYDEYSLFKMPSRALHILEAVLRDDGWTDVKSINPLYHGINGKLTKENFRRIFSSDILLVSFITRTALQSYELAKKYKEENPNGIVVFGGYHATFMPSEALGFGDIIVVGEGEKTLRELGNTLIKDRYELDDVKGLVFNRDGEIIFTAPRELMSQEELSEQPHPYYDEETRKKASVAVIETTRGCPNKCNFCTVWKFGGGRYRTKSIDYIIEELKRIRGMGMSVFITDDNFTANPHLDELSYEIKRQGLNDRYVTAQVDVRGAKPEKIIALKRMGVKAVCIGLESNNNETLIQLGKPFDAGQNQEATRIYGEAKFWRQGMFIVGSSETPDSLKRLLNFACKNTDSAQFFSITPGPGSDLRKVCEEEGKILSNKWYLYDGHHVLIKTENMTAAETQEALYKINAEYYSWKSSLRRLKHSPSIKMSLGLLWYTQINRGVKNTFESPQTLNHLKFLRSLGA